MVFIFLRKGTAIEDCRFMIVNFFVGRAWVFYGIVCCVALLYGWNVRQQCNYRAGVCGRYYLLNQLQPFFYKSIAALSMRNTNNENGLLRNDIKNFVRVLLYDMPSYRFLI